MTPLLYLALRSLRGRVVGWLRLMKQPKYLVGTLAGVAWMGMFALRPVIRVNRRASLGKRFEEIAEWLPAIETAAALMLLVFLSLWWLWPFGKAMLELTETQLHLLLPAPVRRGDISFSTLSFAASGASCLAPSSSRSSPPAALSRGSPGASCPSGCS